MCGILFSSKIILDLIKAIKYLKKRGPDHTEHKIINNYNFVHVLLSMTGKDYTIQPFTYNDNSIVVMFNGEIYNYKEFGDFNSDGECIIESYKKYGDDFVKYLDGEFSILLVDFSKDLLYYSTDIFSIKPLWFAQDNNDIGLCSYESSLKELGFKNINQVEANTTIKMKLSTRKILLKQTVYDFDLNQHKTTFDDWNSAFENAIIKRTCGIKHKIFIGLSGGYDSGLISCVLNKLNIDYKAYTILGSEDLELINERHSKLKKGEIIDIDQEEFLNNNKILKESGEKYYLNIDNGENYRIKEIEKKIEKILPLYTKSRDNHKKFKLKYKNRKINGSTNRYLNEKHDLSSIKNKIEDKYLTLCKANERLLKQLIYRKTSQNVLDDNGAIGMSYICSLSKPQGELIYLSGSGADEVISDYGFNKVKHYGHSTIGGYFPKDLSTVFPWKNFFGNTQRSYLMKEEIVSGVWGIEGRYPFLDKNVVQEFLWLDNSLKNSNYKSVIHNYLVTHNYPFELNKKIGFNCGFSGKKDNFKKKDKYHIKRDETPVGIPKGGRKDLIVDI